LKNLNIAFSSLGVASNYTAGNKLYLGYITDVQDTSTFEIIAEAPFNIENVTYFNMALNNITFPANARLGFKFLYTTGSYQKGVMIDDINITKLPVCDNPTNLTAESIDNTIELNWIIANNATNYIIYRDNVEIATTTETTYSDNSLLFETEYCYYITAICPYGTSESTDIVCATTAPCNPVRNLTSTVDNISVSLNWDTPLGADEWIFWGNGEYYNAIGINAEFDFDVAQRFEPSDLTDYNGKSLTKVGFMPNVSGNLCTYSVRVWVGGSIEAPGQLMVDQVVNSSEITVSQWNIIALQTPITINASQE
ncbi:MAG: fibronectin type III domain-containing protein, partial [Bacilli bacterium]|nr:fibronectin type III domain-containing protein [Bacilli bacterium]